MQIRWMYSLVCPCINLLTYCWSILILQLTHRISARCKITKELATEKYFEIIMEQFVYWYFLYTVTTAAPPSPRLCWRAREAPDTWRFPASPRSWRRKYHTVIITYMVPAIAHGWRSKGHTTSDHNLPASWAQNTELVLLPPGDAPLKSDLHCNVTKKIGSILLWLSYNVKTSMK